MMNIHSSVLRRAFIGLAGVAFVAGALQTSAASKGWTVDSLSKALTSSSRPQADKDRDADRKPAQLMTFFGVEPGMTALDVIAAGGYMSDVLAVAVGPKGKVYIQNPPMVLQSRGGANEKALTERAANNRLPNAVRVDSDFPAASIPPGSVDVAITAMNLHDIYNRDAAAAGAFAKNVYDTLKPGGVFGVVDHVGVVGGDNAKLHRMPKQAAIDVLKSAGFTVEEESNVLANSADDHTKGVFDASLRGKTDQFVLKMRKPK
jgi:predicted methyltransferase